MSSHQHAPKITCPACGTSPVNHRTFLILTTVDNFIQKTLLKIFGWLNLHHEGSAIHYLNVIMVNFFRLLGIIRLSEDRSKVASGRSELIWDEAVRRGIKIQQIIMFKKPLDQYRAKVGKKWIYFQSIPTPPWLPKKGYAWLDDKLKLAQKLEAYKIPAPKARRVMSYKSAQKAFHELEKPLIIKPQLGSRGRHTTTNIKTEDELLQAYKIGRQIALSLVVEEHLFGSVHRATVIDGKLVGFFQANPPRVLGDGVNTIAKLIEIQNKNRPEKIGEIIITDDVKNFIQRYGYTLESVLEKDIVLDLTAKTGRFYGGYTKEILPEIHPKLHDYFERAGKVAEASIVGFDVIIPDPMQDPDEQRWGIIECNSLPFIDLHYYAFEGPVIDLAKNIWDLWEDKFLRSK